MDLELELFGDLKESINKASSVGKIFMLSLSSQPVDHEIGGGRTKVGTEVQKYGFVNASQHRWYNWKRVVSEWAVRMCAGEYLKYHAVSRTVISYCTVYVPNLRVLFTVHKGRKSPRLVDCTVLLTCTFAS